MASSLHPVNELSAMASDVCPRFTADACDAEQSMQLAGRNELRAGPSRFRSRVAERRSNAQCGRSLALDLLHELMDVAVENGDRPKSRQEL